MPPEVAAAPELREIVVDPHIGWAMICVLMAVVAALIAWMLGLPDQGRGRR